MGKALVDFDHHDFVLGNAFRHENVVESSYHLSAYFDDGIVAELRIALQYIHPSLLVRCVCLKLNLLVPSHEVLVNDEGIGD